MCSRLLLTSLVIGGATSLPARAHAHASLRRVSTSSQATGATAPFETLGRVLRHDSAFDQLISEDARLEVLARGFGWSEGPLWVDARHSLLFSDVPGNRIYEWSEDGGLSVFLEPSGYSAGENVTSPLPGSNGLALDSAGRLLLCQHGARRLAVSTHPLRARDEQGEAEKEDDASGETEAAQPYTFATIAADYRGRRFNSPNDLVLHSTGAVYFTDPPYGLPQWQEDPGKELQFQGVFLLRPSETDTADSMAVEDQPPSVHNSTEAEGRLQVFVRNLTFPNGVVLSPDENTLYVSVSDGAHPFIYAYAIGADGLAADEGRIFFDRSTLGEGEGRGVTDGMAVDVDGNVFAGGDGGVAVLSPSGRLLGTLSMGQPCANVAFGGADGSTLFMTCKSHLVRVETKTKGMNLR